MSVKCIFPYRVVDLRDEIAKFEKENRPFPPKSGSVSKPYSDYRLDMWTLYLNNRSEEYVNLVEEEKHLKELSYLKVHWVVEGDMKLRATTRTTTAAEAATDTRL